MFPETFERTCAVCDEVFVQNARKTLECICPDCRKGRKKKVVVPETIDEHIKEEREKSPEFKEAFDKEEKKLEKEAKNGTDNHNHGESGKSV